jgi:hypothetical protein
MGTDQATQHNQNKYMTNIFRRVYRIFAHAWFQHREMFWKVEGRTGLYIFFKMVCDVYSLISEDNYTIPPEAEGEEQASETPFMPPPLILKRDPSGPGPMESDNSSLIEAGDHTLSTAGTTKRHRHSPSVGATAVHTVVEENEDEEGGHEEEPTKDENGNVSDPETIIETPETSDEEAQEPEQPLVAAEAQSSTEPESVAPPDSHTPAKVETEVEEQDSSEVDPTESQKGDDREAEPTVDGDAAVTTEESVVPEKDTEESSEMNSPAEEAEVPAEPAQAGKEEARATTNPAKGKGAVNE